MKKSMLLFLLMVSATLVIAQPDHFIHFNGIDQYMRISHHSDFNIAADESFTVVGWVRVEEYQEYCRYLTKRDIAQTGPGTERTGYEFFGTDEAGKSLGLNTPNASNGHALSTYSGLTIPAGQWTHFALVVDRNADKVRLYHDGVNTHSSSGSVASWTVESTHDVFIGTGNNGGQPIYFCHGDFGNVRFYSMPLTTDQMATDMTTNTLEELPQEMQEALLAAYDFSEDYVEDNHLLDLSGHGHDADMVNFSIGAAQILQVSLQSDNRRTGRGNPHDILLRTAVSFGGTNDSVALQSMTLNLEGTTDLNDITAIKVYSTGDNNAFDWRTAEDGIMIGTCTPTDNDFVCNLNGYLHTGTNYLWVTVAVANDATEGNLIDIALKSLTTTDETFEVNEPNPEGTREILLAHTTIYRSGDYGSRNYRIPAIITAKDGSLVIATDKRKNNSGDLPEDIDVICNYSTDGGHTWSEPYTIAQGTGYNHGFGDCALVQTAEDNGLLCTFVGGVGFWNSTPTNRMDTYICRSHDNGRTWTEPVAITDYIFGSSCIYPEHRSWLSSFFASGNGLRLRNGRLMFVACIRESSAYSANSYAFYSDDEGQTWIPSGRASLGGDEAKVTELDDGRVLMSIRHEGNRWYNISEDGGETWQPNTSTWYDITAPACNGDIIRYTAQSQGYNKNRLLHSVPYGSNRENVTVYVSYDEGETWPLSKCIVPYSSAYSSLCILPDGTIGFYVEESYNGEDGYSMVFYNFSLEWLTDGQDVFEPTQVEEYKDKQTGFIYPNPTDGQIMIPIDDLQKVEIYDTNGRMILSEKVDKQIIIDLSKQTSGLYLVKAMDGNGNKMTQTIVKE